MKKYYFLNINLSNMIVLRGYTSEVSFLSVIVLLPVSVIYHLIAYVVYFQNSHIILIWLPWQRY